MTKKSFVRILSVSGLILLIPLIAMQFTHEVDWNITDFITIGLLLVVTGAALDWVVRKVDQRYRILAAAAVVVVFLLIWAELAVQLVSNLLTGNL